MEPKDFLEKGGTGISLNQDLIGQDSVHSDLMHKKMSHVEYVSPVIYDTETYYEEEKRPTDLFEIDDEDDVQIQILRHKYEKDEYEYTLVSDELPYIDMSWRNAVSFLGRIVKNDEVVYKGNIVLQFDGTRHRIIIMKPWQVNYGSFTNEDPLSLSYNAFDPEPFVFEDYQGDDADNFFYPTVLGVIPYNIPFGIPDSGPKAKYAKTFSTFDKHQHMFLRPYFAIPNMPQIGALNPDLFNLRLNVGLNRDDDGEDFVFDTSITGNGEIYINWEQSVDGRHLQDFLYGLWDLSSSHNDSIRVSLITEVIHNEEITSDNRSIVDIHPSNIRDQRRVLETLSKNDGPLEYKITTEITRHRMASDVDSDNHSYTARVTVSREKPYIDIASDQVIEYETVSTTQLASFEESTSRNSIYVDVDFEGIRFPVKVAERSSSYHDFALLDEETPVEVTIDAEEKLRNVSTATTQPIIVRGERLIDPNDMLENHQLKDATLYGKLDRYALLYGPHMGSNFLQFLEYDRMDHAPFPYNAIDFETEIVHVHNHRGLLYVFTKNGLYILHDGFGPQDMVKTFAYSDVLLDPAEKNTVVSFGNEVFFISRGVGYSIRTNVNVESQDDVYVQPVTHPIGDMLRNPLRHIKTRLEDGYGVVKDFEDKLKVSYFVKASNTELNIFASYYVDDMYFMVTYMFDKDNKRWRTYDTISGAQPLYSIPSGHYKGFDLVMRNHHEGGRATYATYLTRLPENKHAKDLGDVEMVGVDNYNMRPISIMLDTGALGFSTMHTKKMRRIMVNFLDMLGTDFDLYIVPHMDHRDYQNRLNVEVSVGEDEEYDKSYIENVNNFSYSESVIGITPRNIKQEGIRLTTDQKSTTRKVNLLTQLSSRGKLPGFRLYLFTHTQLKIADYALVYREQKAR